MGDASRFVGTRRVALEDEVSALKESGLPDTEDRRAQTVHPTSLSLGLDTGQNVQYQARLELG